MNEPYIVCVCVCARARVRAREREGGRERASERERFTHYLKIETALDWKDIKHDFRRQGPRKET